MSKNVLIIAGHPDLKQSLANRTILEEVAKQLPTAEIRQLDQLHREAHFNIQAEQEALLNADIIVWQFPLHWYSLPALMKQWLDEVFTHGFSHGSTAKLAGKKLILSFTIGAPKALYQEDSVMKHTITQLLAPFNSLAALCHLDLQPPMYLSGMSYIFRDDTAAIEAQQHLARAYASRLVTFINNIQGK